MDKAGSGVYFYFFNKRFSIVIVEKYFYFVSLFNI